MTELIEEKPCAAREQALGPVPVAAAQPAKARTLEVAAVVVAAVVADEFAAAVAAEETAVLALQATVAQTAA